MPDVTPGAARAPARRVALGIDIGGTKIAAAVVSADGVVIAHARGATAPESNEAGLSSIFAVADQALAAAGQRRSEVAGIGSPGFRFEGAGLGSGAVVHVGTHVAGVHGEPTIEAQEELLSELARNLAPPGAAPLPSSSSANPQPLTASPRA